MPPLSFGHFPRERGKPMHPSTPLDSGFRRNDEDVRGYDAAWASPASRCACRVPLHFAKGRLGPLAAALSALEGWAVVDEFS